VSPLVLAEPTAWPFEAAAANALQRVVELEISRDVR
jgi:hypothetical protein